MVVIVMLIAPAGVGFAQSSIDLSAESTGLLPSNPFYFLKEWGRGFRKFIAFNAVKKAELELNTVNEKAAELKKLQEIATDNVGALMGAAENYKSAVEQLQIRLEGLKETNPSASWRADVDRLLNQLTEKSLAYQQLFNGLSERFASEEKLNKEFNGLQEKIADLLATAAERLDSPQKFRARLESALNNQKDEFKDLRAVELANRLEERLSGDFKKEVGIFKDDILIKISGRLQGADLSSPTNAQSILESLPGEFISRLKLLDEVREKITAPNLKNEINIVRQQILEKSSEDKQIGKEEAQKAIDSAANLIAEVEEKITVSDRTVRQSVAELLQRAKFNLDQAEKLLEEENYSGAFGQATAAYAAIRNAWIQLTANEDINAQTLESLKSDYDSLIKKSGEAGITKEKSPKLFELLTDAEKKIIELNRLIDNKAAPEVVAATLRNVKLTLATAEELIAGILKSLSPIPSSESEKAEF